MTDTLVTLPAGKPLVHPAWWIPFFLVVAAGVGLFAGHFVGAEAERRTTIQLERVCGTPEEFTSPVRFQVDGQPVEIPCNRSTDLNAKDAGNE